MILRIGFERWRTPPEIINAPDHVKPPDYNGFLAHLG
jgi:hypothetical protein